MVAVSSGEKVVDLRPSLPSWSRSDNGSENESRERERKNLRREAGGWGVRRVVQAVNLAAFDSIQEQHKSKAILYRQVQHQHASDPTKKSQVTNPTFSNLQQPLRRMESSCTSLPARTHFAAVRQSEAAYVQEIAIPMTITQPLPETLVQRSAHLSSTLFVVEGEGFPNGVLPLLSRFPLVPRPLDGEGPCAAAEEGRRAFGSPGGVDTLRPFFRGESLGEALLKDRKRQASPAPGSFIALGMVSVLAARGIGGVLLVPSREPFLARGPPVFGAATPPPLALWGSVEGGWITVLAGVGEVALKPEQSRLAVVGLGGASPGRDEAVVGVDDRFALTTTGGVVEAFSAVGMVFERTILTFAASAVPWRGACCFGNSSTSLRLPTAGEDEKTRRARSALRNFSFFLRTASFWSVSKIRPSKPPSLLISLPPPPSWGVRDPVNVAAVTRLAVFLGESANSLRGLHTRLYNEMGWGG